MFRIFSSQRVVAASIYRIQRSSPRLLQSIRCFTSSEDLSANYIPSAASQVFENMDDRDRFAILNRISLPLNESDLSRIAVCVKTDFKVSNVMTLRKRLYQYAQLWVPMDGNILQVLYSCLFRQRQFKLLLSFHQYLLKRDGKTVISLPVADMLMTSAVMERKLQFASDVWKSVPETWRSSPRLYCSFAMLLFSKRLVDDGMQILEVNQYKQTGYRDVSQNWKVLKGLELSGCYRKCLEFADVMCEVNGSKNPLLHPLCIDSMIGSLCKLRQYKQVNDYYKLAVKNNIRIEGTAFEKMIRLHVSNDVWKVVYSDMLEKARENNVTLSQDDNWFLQWHAKSYSFRQAGTYFLEQYRKSHTRFFFIDEDKIHLEQRKTSLAQMEIMLYILLDNPPNRFLVESKPEYTLEINKHQNVDQIELFLKETVYPPIQYKRTKEIIQIPLTSMIDRWKEVDEMRKRLEPVLLTPQELGEIMGY